MFWADRLLQNISGKQLINDSTTPSGIVHMGSLKGPIIHDILFRILKEKGIEVHFKYGFDDLDPIDGLAPNLRESHSKYLGIPISIAPAPDEKGTYGEYFSSRMEKLLTQLGITPEIYRTSELYKKGVFDNAIKFVLDHAQEVRDVYSEVYKKEIKKDWYPLQVICPNCGKLGTTKVTDWDGKEVSYTCQKDLVKWAIGCESTGKMSPFGGNAKMPWKVEWAAKWWTFGVTIEGAGKDHASAGGSYDIAMKLLSDVFKKEPPLKLAYEFFLSGGKKMASSKGIGLTGEELLKVLPPELVRFLMIKTPPNQAVEFTPKNTDVIPKLYNDYKKAAYAYTTKKGDDLERVFVLSQIDPSNPVIYPDFDEVVMVLQNPSMKEKEKDPEFAKLMPYAKYWLENFAPSEKKNAILEDVSEQVKSLNDIQKKYLKALALLIQNHTDAKRLEEEMYSLSTELGLPSKEAFAAIYTVLLGKPNGPKASFLLLSLDKGFLQKRFNEIPQA